VAKAKSGGAAKSTPKSESVQAAQAVAKAAARPVPAQAKKAEAAEVKKQSSQTAAKNKAQESRDASRSAGRNSPVSKTNPGPIISTPLKTGTASNGGGNGGRNNQDNNIFVDTNPQMDPTPEPVSEVISEESSPIRIAQRNVFDISSLVPQFSPEHIAKILFENVSAIELSISERHDTIEGINQRYSIISNLSEVRKRYDAQKQLSIMDKFKPLTSIYTINIEDKIPQQDYIELEALDSTYQYLDENNQLVTREKGYYYIDKNGDLVIDLINLERNQQVEVYIDTNGTIYKVES
jgi:hypothetical protein